MGQYYNAVLLGADDQVIGWVCSCDYNNGSKLLEHAWRENPFVAAVEMLLTKASAYAGSRLVWAGDYADNEPESDENLYKRCDADKKLVPEEMNMAYYRYIVNHTKKQFVDKERCDKYTKLHPLPLLTCEGNGRGGGDYNGDHAIIGNWARDSISVEKVCPKGYIEIIFDLPV